MAVSRGGIKVKDDSVNSERLPGDLWQPAADHLGWTNKIVFLQEKNTQNLFYDFPPIGPARANSDILKMSGWSFQANWRSLVHHNVFPGRYSF